MLDVLRKDSILMNSVKNVLQFLTGVVLFYLTFGIIDIYTVIIGGLAFFFTYSAVYPFNDLMDLKEDKGEDKKKFKALVRGDINKRDSISILFIFLALGVFFLSFLNKYFVLIIFLTLFLNFLHSSNLTRWKENFYLVGANMMLLQFLKFSSGWFLMTANISRFPLFILVTFSGAYSIIYLYYKNKLKRGMKLKRKVWIGGIAGLSTFSFFISLILSSFQIPLLLLAVFSVMILFTKVKLGDKVHIPRIGGSLIMIAFIFLLFSFYILTNPQIAQSNKKLKDKIDDYEKKLPEELTRRLKMINNKTRKYETLKELEKIIESERGKITNITEDESR